MVGFCASFGAKYFGGYARNSKDDNSGGWSEGAIKNLKKQAPNLKNITFRNMSYLDIPVNKLKNYVIYCDIPYKDTTKYSTSVFQYDNFYNWIRDISSDNIVLISEYSMPNDFICMWRKEHKTLLDSNKTSQDRNNIRYEGLFTYRDGLAAQIFAKKKVKKLDIKIEELIKDYIIKHPLAATCGGEYIYQDDEAQADAIELVSHICESLTA